MYTLTLHTLTGTYEWGMRHHKILFGKNYEARHAIMQALRHHFTQTHTTEFLNEYGGEVSVLRDGLPYSPRDTLFVEIAPHYDFEADAKMRTHSPLLVYAQTLLEDIPTTDTYALLRTAYTALMDEITTDRLTLQCGDVRITFREQEITPKILIKLLTPELIKQDCETSGTTLSLSEGVALQCAIIEKIARVTPHNIVALYDGIVTCDILNILRTTSEQAQHISCIINAHNPHDAGDIDAYFLCGATTTLDCADDNAVDYVLGMEMPYHGDTADTRRDIAAYIAGNRSDKNNYIERFF